MQNENISPKHCSQHLATVAKIFFSGPFKKQGFSLAMSQLEMVVCARDTAHMQRAGENNSSQNYSIAVVLMFFQNCFVSGPSGRFQLCSLVAELRVVSAYRERCNQKSGNWPTG